ncbi:cytochrome c oxidase subunit II [Nocardia cyriacigeorgica]|uniref:cytochrome-c oxidase n=2 Tax=Nocardia cyriacigeorgica TaxID=135487 RepID=A0A6P1DAA4_9NOCA|nr:cytochrome c oxidase subunit II [Nocardia cyriacigeorgica]NEW47058.1 cytochrome c oxidase subunit II [Nocardia cyriacigeorgica]NEW51847.1 cytochrome c oxidase subunit II [Nocardia cyriacigeorgica]NEW58306.1 cytochrome c oxidase subunit II [Nocardia cyriacigeorgica]
MAHKASDEIGARPARGRQGRILRRAGLAVSLGITAMLVSGCSIDNVWLRFGWPSGITPQATRMRELWTWSVIAALVMGVLVWGLTFWTIAFHRKKKDSPEFPRQTGYNVPLELSYTAAPFVIIAVLFYFTVVVQNYVHEKVDNPDVVVDVTAFQWNWKFGYRDIDLKNGFTYDGIDTEREGLNEEQLKAYEERIDPEHGHPQPGPVHGKPENDILSYLHYDKIETIGSSNEIPVLVLPTGKTIEFQLAAADVIHAFWVPEFLFKRDVMPNPKENHSDNVFQITEIEKEGAFVGRCAEMCGTYHSMMNFEVRAVSPEKFQAYIEARDKGMTNAQALESIGESPVATSTRPFNTDRTVKSAAESN